MIRGKIKIFLELVKFEHTIFALPFAYLGAILASFSLTQDFPAWTQLGWITISMVAARTAAMAFNRLIDMRIDAGNPRTQNRALPAGIIRSFDVTVLSIGSLLVFMVAAFQLSDLAIQLLPIALIMLVTYSYTKRWSWACHFFLGLTIGLAPLGAWVAVTNQFSFEAFILYIVVAMWCAGFDIIYACQDVDFDRQAGLYSIPSRFGISFSLILARILHAFTILGLILLHFLLSFGYWSLVGVGIASYFLYREHQLVSAHDLSKIPKAFFTMNSLFSGVIFLFTLIDILWVTYAQ